MRYSCVNACETKTLQSLFLVGHIIYSAVGTYSFIIVLLMVYCTQLNGTSIFYPRNKSISMTIEMVDLAIKMRKCEHDFESKNRNK